MLTKVLIGSIGQSFLRLKIWNVISIKMDMYMILRTLTIFICDGKNTSWSQITGRLTQPWNYYCQTQSLPINRLRQAQPRIDSNRRIKSISGASFAGFYYICFEKSTGILSGIYFVISTNKHHNSEWFQQLHLEHIPEKSFASFEFR